MEEGDNMATSDRLYEVACDCRDLETRLDRLTRDLHDKGELLIAFRLAAGALLEEINDAKLVGPSLPAGVVRRAEELRNLTS